MAGDTDDLSPKSQRMKKLYGAIRRSRTALQFQRDTFASNVREFVGAHYSKNGSGDKVPIDLLGMAVSVLRRHLVSDFPQVLIQTDDTELLPDAYTYELAVNRILRDIGYGEETRKSVTGSIFSVGFQKVALMHETDFEFEGKSYRYGRPFAADISLDHWFHDMAVGDLRDATFMGHIYRLPLDFVKDSDLFQHKDKIKAVRHHELPREMQGETEKIRSGNNYGLSDADEYVEFTEVMDVYLSLEGRYITIPVEEAMYDGDLSELAWEDDESPYFMLGLIDVPNQVIPLSPVERLVDLHDLANRLFRKLGRQADRQKTVLAYQSSAQQDAQNIVDAADGQSVKVDHVEAIKEIQFAGISRENLAFLMHLYERFSYLFGNMDSVGGLSAAADTLGQEELMASSASRMIAEFQDRAYGFVKKALTRITKYVWEDPILTMRVAKRIPGTDLVVPAFFGPHMKQGRHFNSFSVDVLPCSLRRETPETKLQTVKLFLRDIVFPLMPVLQAQGVEVNFEGVCRIFERYGNLPEIQQLITFAAPSADGQRPMLDVLAKPPVTNRTYTRKNEGSGRPQGAMQDMISSLMSGGAR
jgi:hypothetical protein